MLCKVLCKKEDVNPKKKMENHVRHRIFVKVTTKRNIYTYLSFLDILNMCRCRSALLLLHFSTQAGGLRRRFSYVENEICRKPNLVYSILCIVFFTQLILPATLSNGVRRKIEVVSIENKQQTSWLTGLPH